MKLKELKELIECCKANGVSRLKDGETELSFIVDTFSPTVIGPEIKSPELTPEEHAQQIAKENDRLMFMSSE